MNSWRRGAARVWPGAFSLIFAAALCLGPRPMEAGTIVIQPINVCDSGGANCGDALPAVFEQATEDIWAQAGISVDFLTPEAADTTTSGALDVNSDAILNELFDYGTLTPDPLFSSSPAYAGNLVITLWIVPFLDDCGSGYTTGIFGCSLEPGNEIAIGDNVFDATRLDTIAHEIGHNLGLSHCEDAPAQCDNTVSPYWLMDSGGSRIPPSSLSQITPEGGYDLLSSTEIGIAQGSPLDRDQAPEPATASLALLGVGILWVRRRSRPDRRKSGIS